MNHSQEIDKIIPALIEAKKSIAKVAKSGENTFDRYKYAKLEDYISAYEEPLLANGLVVVASVVEVLDLEPRQRAPKKGASESDNYSVKQDYACRIKMEFRLVHLSGQWISAACSSEAQDRSDKATYKAITGCRKYGVAVLLDMVTTDDPEKDASVGIDDDAGDPNKNRHGQARASAPDQKQEVTF